MVPIPTDPEAQRLVVQAARAYADCILLKPLREIGEVLGDQIGHWKLMNKVRCLHRAKEYMAEKGVDPVKMLPDVFVPLMDEAGDTDDETLSDMFARLLAAHLDPIEQNGVHRAFSKVLGQLSPLDVRVLNIMDERERLEAERRGFRNEKASDWSWSEKDIVAAAKEANRQDDVGLISLSLDNLGRLGLWGEELSAVPFDIPVTPVEIQPEFGGSGTLIHSSAIGAGTLPTAQTVTPPLPHKGVVIAKFGRMLLRAVNDPASYWRNRFRTLEERQWRRQVMRQRREKVKAERHGRNPERASAIHARATKMFQSRLKRGSSGTASPAPNRV
jgi:hypothetical protein